MSSLSAVITGTGMSVPDRVLTNHDLEKMVETTDQWITDRTGIKKRHVVDGQKGRRCGATPCELFDNQTGIKTTHPQPPGSLRGVHAHEAHVTGSLQRVLWKHRFSIPVGRMGGEFTRSKLPGATGIGTLFVIQFVVQGNHFPVALTVTPTQPSPAGRHCNK